MANGTFIVKMRFKYGSCSDPKTMTKSDTPVSAAKYQENDLLHWEKQGWIVWTR